MSRARAVCATVAVSALCLVLAVLGAVVLQALLDPARAFGLSVLWALVVGAAGTALLGWLADHAR